MNTDLTTFDWNETYATNEEFKETIDSICKTVLSNLPEWSAKTLTNPIRNQPGLREIPLLCKGTECDYASKCEVLNAVKDKPAEIIKLIGTTCRIEEVMIPEYFMRYLHFANVKPTDFGDILAISNLVSLIVQRRRILLDISIHGINERMTVGIQQGQAIKQRTNNPSFKLLESVNKQIAVIEGQLATSRKDRMSLENKNVDKLETWLKNIQQNKDKAAKQTPKPLTITEANDLITDEE